MHEIGQVTLKQDHLSFQFPPFILLSNFTSKFLEFCNLGWRMSKTFCGLAQWNMSLKDI